MSDSPRKNLKGRYEKLVYYRYKDTGIKEEVSRLSNGKEQRYKRVVKEKIYFDEDEVRSFSLETLGTPLPRVHGQFIQIDNYFFDFWGYFLGCEATALFVHLIRHAINKDYCWPELSLIAFKMKKSLKAVRGYMDILEEYGFIYRFWVQNVNKNFAEESPIIKIRKTIPLLSEELIAQLPEKLRKEHDKYLADLMESYEIQIADEYPIDDTLHSFMEKGRVIHSKKLKEKIERLMGKSTQQHNIMDRLSSEDKQVWESVKKELRNQLSKPSFETWFEDTYAKFDGESKIIILTNEFSLNHISIYYNDLIKEILYKLYNRQFEVEYRMIEREQE